MVPFRHTIWTSLLSVVLLHGIGPSAVRAQNDEPESTGDAHPSAEQSAQSQARFEYMVQALRKYRVVLDGEDSQPATLNPSAFLRWSNPLGDVMDGLLTVYATSETARPAVMAHFHVHGPKHKWLEMHEFASVHPGQIQLLRGDRDVWNPQGRYGEFQPLVNAPGPSENKTIRLTQIKRMAERFTIIDHFREPRSKPVPTELRMLSRPVYRYGAEDGTIVDGAVFVFVVVTDPEACLLLEVHQQGDTQQWQYALFPLSIYTLEGKLDDELVWTKPEAMVFGNRTAPHYPAPYRGDVGERRLQTYFPDAKDN